MVDMDNVPEIEVDEDGNLIAKAGDIVVHAGLDWRVKKTEGDVVWIVETKASRPSGPRTMRVPVSQIFSPSPFEKKESK